MGAIEIAVQGAKRLETLLQARFGAEGRGLHEKLTSVENKIPSDLRKSIRWVATIRNKVVHEDGPPPSMGDFARTVERIARGLDAASRPRASPPKKKAARRTSRRRKSRPTSRLLFAAAVVAAVAAVVLVVAFL
jgi:hypothetical protein